MITKRAARLQPLTDRATRKALAEPIRNARNLQLRQLFAGDLWRGARPSGETVYLYLELLEERGDRRDDQAFLVVGR